MNLFSNKLCNLISISNTVNSIFITNVDFIEILFFENIIIIDKADTLVFIKNVQFYKNNIYNFLFHVQNSLNVTFQYVSSFSNNNNNGEYYNQGGGSFRFYNTIYLCLINLQISYGLSVKTSFGVVIVDDMLSYANNDTDRIVLFYKSLFYLIIIKILLKNSLFQNNFLFYFDENQEAGGAVYLNSDRNMVIEDCLFQVYITI